MPSIKIKSNINEVVGGSMEYLQTTIAYPVSSQVKNEIGWTITTIANLSLNQYIDREARRSPKSFHHVYEWNKVGNSNHRLWKTTPTYRSGVINIATEFLPSKSYVPIKNGSSRRHKFIFKAKVMEAGKPVKIKARQADALFFIGSSGPVFIKSPKAVVVKTPGGKKVAKSFSKALIRYQVSPRLEAELNAIGFFKKLEDALAKAAKSMPSLSGKPSKSYLRTLAQVNTSRHINQVLRQYRTGGIALNG
jgi:hypothetical protein